MHARGESGACLAAADQLLTLAQPNNMRELTAIALRWRGEALIADKHFTPAREALMQASELTEAIARPRLSWDVHRSLARLARQTGAAKEEHRRRAAAQEIAARIEHDLSGAELRFASV